jgi:hypothetical protein
VPHAGLHFIRPLSNRPWTIEEANDACFIVRDSTKQAVGYF